VLVQARNAHLVGVGDGASSCRRAQRSARRLRSDPVVPLPLVLSAPTRVLRGVVVRTPYAKTYARRAALGARAVAGRPAASYELAGS